MGLPSWMTTVTPFSKKLALFLYLFLPFAGFYLGMQYAGITNQTTQLREIVYPYVGSTPTPTLVPFPTVEPVQRSTWKTYRSKKYGYSIAYPPTVILRESTTAPSGSEVSIDTDPVYVTLSNQDLQLIINPNPGGRGIDPLKQESFSLLNQQIAKVYETENTGLIFNINLPDNKVLSVSFLIRNGMYNMETNLLINQIISTFQINEITTPLPTISEVGGAEGNANNTICTMDAKVCPDGSYVSRTGPSCEFAACPRQ